MKRIVKGYVTTQKSSKQKSQNKFTLLVEPKANKFEIKRALEDPGGVFKVKVEKIRTIRQKSKKRNSTQIRRFPGGSVSSIRITKKAIITLVPGYQLDEGKEEKKRIN